MLSRALADFIIARENVNMSETEAYLQFKAHFRETKKSFYKYRDHHYIRCLQRNSPAGRNHLTKIFVITER